MKHFFTAFLWMAVSNFVFASMTNEQALNGLQQVAVACNPDNQQVSKTFARAYGYCKGIIVGVTSVYHALPIAKEKRLCHKGATAEIAEKIARLMSDYIAIYSKLLQLRDGPEDTLEPLQLSVKYVEKTVGIIKSPTTPDAEKQRINDNLESFNKLPKWVSGTTSAETYIINGYVEVATCNITLNKGVKIPI